nr:coatomer subunit zeta-1-like [Pocillopora verrucosa]
MDSAVLEASLYTVKAIAILDNDGERVVAKYYDDQYQTTKEQKEFEKNLFNKTHRANAEIIMLDGLTCVYRSNVDLFFYVMGSSNENEVNVLIGFQMALSSVCDDRAHDVTLPILYRSKSADALIPRRKSMAILS